MPSPARAGALIYAKDVEHMSAFYQQVVGMRLLHGDAERHVIGSADMQLILHALPAHLAGSVTVSSPPVPREEQAIKLFFTVPSLSEAEAAASSLAGAVFGPVYSGPGFRVRNAYDPEGNIFHVRESTA
jgi:predicted enzyme related to lactoylglutathione lyase